MLPDRKQIGVAALIGFNQTVCLARDCDRNVISTEVLLSSRPMAENPSHPIYAGGR
jgi:hypothetical protein